MELVFVGFSLLFCIPTFGRLVAGLQRDLLCTKCCSGFRRAGVILGSRVFILKT